MSAHHSEEFHALHILFLIIVGDTADNRCINTNFDSVGAVFVDAVVGVQCVKHG